MTRSDQGGGVFRSWVWPALLGLLGLWVFISPLPAQTTDNIVSEHVRLRIPSEREWLGREVIPELERAWQFVDRALAGRLPRRVLIVGLWDQGRDRTRAEDATVFIGMDTPPAIPDPKGYFVYQSTRELARMGLLELSRRGAGRPANRNLMEGMIEILAREFLGSIRGLNGAWVYCHYLDRLGLLSIAGSASGSDRAPSAGDYYSAAPGATFLLSCRQRFGREKLFKVFEALRKDDYAAALSSTLGIPTAELERLWLERVRSYDVSADSTVTTDADIPALVGFTLSPPAPAPGTVIQLRFAIEDQGLNLSARGVFLSDMRSGRVFQCRDGLSDGKSYYFADVPLDGTTAPGEYRYRVTAVDEAGNLRHWDGEYKVTG